MVGCHHRLKGHEFEQTLGDSEGQGSLDSGGQGSLACCNPWAYKELALLFESDGQSTGASASASILPVNIQG